MKRSNERSAFLARHGFDACDFTPLPQDASPRQYFRLKGPAAPRILMDVAPKTGLGINPFYRIDAWLREQGLHAPEIYVTDEAAGFALMEDFGDGLFARLLADGKADETTLYCAAVDVLVHLHGCKAPVLPDYDMAFTLFEASLALTWYAPAPNDVQEEMATLLRDAFVRLEPARDVVVLRDYHAENLFWLPGDRVGLIDFQDARLGHPAYDLASLLGDARRDVSPKTREAALAHYIARTGTDVEQFNAALALWGAQRNLKILGLFARLARRDGKAKYLEMLPLVWRNLMADLSHPSLAALNAFVGRILPPPNAKQIEMLKGRTT